MAEGKSSGSVFNDGERDLLGVKIEVALIRQAVSALIELQVSQQRDQAVKRRLQVILDALREPILPPQT